MKKVACLSVFLFFFSLTVSALAADTDKVYPAKQGRYYSCEDEFQIAYIYQPIMTKSSSNLIANGKFIMLRVRIQNLSGDFLSNLSSNSFRIAQRVGSKEISFPLDAKASKKTSSIWDMRTLDRQFGTFEVLDTWLVFDVNGYASDPWYLIFTPMDDYNRTPYCTLRLQVPPISNK